MAYLKTLSLCPYHFDTNNTETIFNRWCQTSKLKNDFNTALHSFCLFLNILIDRLLHITY